SCGAGWTGVQGSDRAVPALALLSGHGPGVLRSAAGLGGLAPSGRSQREPDDLEGCADHRLRPGPGADSRYLPRRYYHHRGPVSRAEPGSGLALLLPAVDPGDIAGLPAQDPGPDRAAGAGRLVRHGAG